MFFIISKILSYFLSPLLWIIILLFWALLAKNRKKRERALLASLVTILLFTNSFVVFWPVKIWAVKPVFDKDLKEGYDVGIVLGGSTITFDNDFNRQIYTGNIDRLLQAVSLYKKGKIKKILVTGASGDLIYRNHKEGKMMYDFLRKIGIPGGDILVDTLAENTHQNAVYVKKMLGDGGEHLKLLLITSSLHMRRARACFEHENLKADLYATNPVSTSVRWNFEFLFVPDASNLLIWNGIVHEIFGYAVYKIYGYI